MRVAIYLMLALAFALWVPIVIFSWCVFCPIWGLDDFYEWLMEAREIAVQREDFGNLPERR